jgi:hypothetical protein
MEIELYKEMALGLDVPGHRLRAGDVGTVVEILPHPSGGPRGIVLEIFNALGESIDVVRVAETDLQPLTSNEVFNARPLSKTG